MDAPKDLSKEDWTKLIVDTLCVATIEQAVKKVAAKLSNAMKTSKKTPSNLAFCCAYVTYLYKSNLT